MTYDERLTNLRRMRDETIDGLIGLDAQQEVVNKKMEKAGLQLMDLGGSKYEDATTTVVFLSNLRSECLTSLAHLCSTIDHSTIDHSAIDGLIGQDESDPRAVVGIVKKLREQRNMYKAECDRTRPELETLARDLGEEKSTSCELRLKLDKAEDTVQELRDELRALAVDR